MYRPKSIFNVPMILLVPTATIIKGSPKKTYTPCDFGAVGTLFEFPFEIEGLEELSTKKTTGLFYGSFKTFGGTEVVKNDLLSVENTAVVECWYNPFIKSDCRISVNGNNYEIIGTPENIEMRNQFLQFKIRELKGGV